MSHNTFWLLMSLILVLAAKANTKNARLPVKPEKGSSVDNPIDMGIFGSLIVGYGPAGHNFLYRATEIDVNKKRRGRRYATIEKLAFSPARCGKIDDIPIAHARHLNNFTGRSNCKFDESCKSGMLDCSTNDNYHLDIAHSINAIDDKQWYAGVAPLRFIKNGGNEPTRCLVNDLQRPAYCSRFKATTFASRGVQEDNVDAATGDSPFFATSLQKEYKYRFPNPDWQRPQMEDLLCNVYCLEGCEGGCSTTLDDYLLLYSLSYPKPNGEPGVVDVNPFTGDNCTELGNCPFQVCHNYLTVHEFYANILGYRNSTTNVVIPNFEAAEHILDFNVGYFGDVYGAHEPCGYMEWNQIEYSTAAEFCYQADGLSGICRDMHTTSKRRIEALGGTLVERYSEQAVSVSASTSVLTVITRQNDTYRAYKVNKNQGELILGLPPAAVKELTGNVMNVLKAARAPIISHPKAKTPRGGSRYLDQPKEVNPLTINTITRKPIAAFTFEETNRSHFHMSSRLVGRNGWHSRAEFFNNPINRRTNLYRPIYTDYLMQNEWLAIINCIDEGNCNSTALKTRILQNWRLQFPNEHSIQALTEADILEVYYKQTMGGWCFQTPGNRNTAEQLADWAVKPFPGFDVCMISASFGLKRDGWMASAFSLVSKCIQNMPRYNDPAGDSSPKSQYWAKKLYCGLRPKDVEDPFDTDITIALNNEHPRIVDNTSFSGYRFPAVDATYGQYNGVIISKANSSYNFTPCRYDAKLRECTNEAFRALANVPCSRASAGAPLYQDP